jgi:transcriptional regulator with XRE-family HTH domain
MGTTLLDRFAQRVMSLRRERALRVDEVARALGCDPSTIYNLERARHALAFHRLSVLAAALGVDELDLFTFPRQSPRHDLVDLTRGASPDVLRDATAHLRRRAR